MRKRQEGYIGPGPRRAIGVPNTPAILTLDVPFSDAGSGVAAITFTKGNGAATFTRATTAYTRLSTGLWAQVASGSPRSFYDSDGTYLGYLAEGARTNYCLQSNDFTNAAWTKSNMTTAKTATGPDGAANSASTLTATAGNATALQALVRSSTARLTGCFIKRRTGTGSIELTQDNGGTWTAVTVTAAWTQVEIAGVTSANPTVGIRIVTNADAVDVWCYQHEEVAAATNKMSTPIPTTAASDTRNIDSLTIPQVGNGISDKASTIYAEATCFNRGSTAAVFGGSAGAQSPLLVGSNTASMGDGTNSASFAVNTWTNNALHKVASTWGRGTLNISMDGTHATRTVYDGTILPATSIFVGLGVASQFAIFGTIKNFRVYNGTMSDGELDALTVATNLIEPLQLTDAAPFEAGGGYSFSDTSGQIVFTTNADAVVVDAVNSLSSETYLSVYVDGAYNQQLTVAGALGVVTNSTRTVSGLGKTAKTVAIMNGPQVRAGQGGIGTERQGTFLKRIGCHTHSITRTTPSTTGRVLVYADSIGNGYNGSPLSSKGWVQQVRISKYPLSVCCAGSGYEGMLHLGSDATQRALTVARVVAFNPAKLWLAVGVNDWNFLWMTAPAFQTAYAALLDDLHTALPSLAVFACSPIIKSTEAANPSYTLGDFRTATSAACVGRAWATYVDGNAIMLVGDLADGLHPANAGHDKYAAAAIAAMGL
jgi:hypothetical protein